MKGCVAFLAFALLAAIAVIGVSLSPEMLLNRFGRRDIAVAVGGQSITGTQLREALRDELWRQGKAWAQFDAPAQASAREEALKNLITKQLVRHYREHASSPPPANEASAQNELITWRKQFQEDTESQARLALHQWTAPAQESQIRADQLDQAWLEAQLTGSIVTVTPAEVKAWYTAHSETLRVPKAYHAAHIYLTRHDPMKPDRQEEIKAIFHQFISGKATFEQLAAQYSEDDRNKTRGGDLDWFTAARMPADFIATMNRLRVGQISPPVLTSLGWHIIQLTDLKDPVIPPFESVSAEIEAVLRLEKRAAAIEILLQNFRQKAEWEGLLQRHADVIAAAVPADLS